MNDGKNFNTNTNTDVNIEEAYSMSECTYSHSELCDMLKFGNIQEKQIAALKLVRVNNTEEACILLNNLTGCDGKIREAIAFKINLLISNSDETKDIFAQIAAETFANATIDINANICRLITNSANMLKEYTIFSKTYSSLIVKYTNEALNELDKFIFRDKKYVINKQLFKLYWCLEALIYFQNNVNENTILEILTRCINLQEYTIREKCAQIVANSNKFSSIKEILENDKNYYVKQVFKSSMLL